jgi:hypothetical protein
MKIGNWLPKLETSNKKTNPSAMFIAYIFSCIIICYIAFKNQFSYSFISNMSLKEILSHIADITDIHNLFFGFYLYIFFSIILYQYLFIDIANFILKIVLFVGYIGSLGSFYRLC